MRPVGEFIDRFEAAGVTPEDIKNDDKTADFEEFTLSESEAEVMYDAFGQCNVNLREMMIESMAGDVFQLGNGVWKIEKLEMGKLHVQDAHGQTPSIPF